MKIALMFLLGSMAHATAVCDAVPRATPQEVGLHPERVAEFLEKLRKAGTLGVAVFKDGRFVAGFGEDKRSMIFSVTKAVTALATARMMTDGAWNDFDTPIGNYLPEFAPDPKGKVTLRQLLSHTSGIRDARDERGLVLKTWNDSKDWVKSSLALPLQDPPGTVYKYNNQGPVLIAAAIERIRKESLERYVRRELFEPMCIRNVQWMSDAAGHTAGYMGLSLTAFDLAKLGHLVLNEGVWSGKRLLSADSVRLSAYTPSQNVRKDIAFFWRIQIKDDLPLPLLVTHSGDGGQHLLLFPNQKIVVARLRRGEDARETDVAQWAFDSLVVRK